jgi:hypothetical protein
MAAILDIEEMKVELAALTIRVTVLEASVAVLTLTQTANTVLAGPATGPAAAPQFRALVTADIPV